MQKWDKIRFSSTTMIDSIYGSPKRFAEIAKDNKHFGNFTAYATPQVSSRVKLQSYGKPVIRQVQTRRDGSKRDVNKTYLNNSQIKRILEREGIKVSAGNAIYSPMSKGVPTFIQVPFKSKSSDGTRINHKNISKYVFDEYLFQNKYIENKL